MKQYLKRTWKNKLVAILLLFASLVPIWWEGDATVLALLFFPIIYLFFTTCDLFDEEVRHDK